MLLSYVDESYSSDRYYMAALLVPEGQAIPLSHALDEVVSSARDSYGRIKEDAELHGTDLLHGKKDWEPLHGMVRARIGVYNDAFKAIAEHDVAIILRGLDCNRHRARYVDPWPPHQVVLSRLLERIHDHAREREEYALIIADECGQQGEYRKDLKEYQTNGTGGWRDRKLECIVDTLHFAPSHASRLIQAADLIAFLHHRIHSGADKDERARRANENLWERIRKRVVHELYA
ncbi:DUF3800 domain-containing protein [Nonomuraea sp. NPDC001636]|uniref:DUF3800 domain-containing protein n=1 Tax=Nonomuraea sp. NPDC001636 TaxID=3154391 RepID=UPI003327838C